jgi:hypothetical protein
MSGLTIVILIALGLMLLIGPSILAVNTVRNHTNFYSFFAEFDAIVKKNNEAFLAARDQEVMDKLDKTWLQEMEALFTKYEKKVPDIVQRLRRNNADMAAYILRHDPVA